MKTLLSWLLCAFASSAVSAAPRIIQLPPETARFSPAPGAEIAQAQCLVCHSAEYVTTQPNLSQASWKAIVEKMQKKFGAQIPDPQIDPLVEYLRNSAAATSK